jgi:hypothetical protein
MNTITFLPRNHKSSNNNSSNSTDALRLIEYILGLDKDNRIVPNGKLYKLATRQYNESVRNSLIRPSIPTWFCGKIDDDTGLLSTTETDVQLREQSGVSTPETVATSDITGDVKPYPLDTCLPKGTPGSPGYSDCKTGAVEDTDTGVDLAGLDWSAEVYSVATGGGSCQLYNATGRLLETGIYKGLVPFHGVPAYLFSKKGGSYGKNVRLKSAGRTWIIEDGSKTIKTTEFRWYPISEDEGTLFVGIYVKA